jgi:hypothetical protein
VNYQPIPDSALLGDLPKVAQCPFAEDFELGSIRGPIPLPGDVVVNTGYQYSAGLCESPDQRGVPIEP